MRKTLTFVIIMIAIGELFFYRFCEDREISCVGNINYFKGDDKLSLIIGQKMNDGKGLLTLSGALYEGKESRINVSKVIQFDYHEENNILIAQSTLIQNSPMNEIKGEEEKKWFPEFFVKKGGKLPLTIKRTGIDTWIFYSNPVPLFICEK
ncbi:MULTISPECIES: hypothetical protein [unclassified Erwinia]|uniref:hypothetical protein n=1 Tax=unclassified Erwinia TaxID=2622719 RepID=UPI0009ECFA5F|nr:hypothetical protein [Erwinia sp. ErVv1]